MSGWKDVINPNPDVAIRVPLHGDSEDDDVQGMVFKSEFRFSIDFKEWRKNPITRRAALKNAWLDGKAGHVRDALYWIRAAWRGYWSGTVFNAGVE